jgi:hypothetical protein
MLLTRADGRRAQCAPLAFHAASVKSSAGATAEERSLATNSQPRWISRTRALTAAGICGPVEIDDGRVAFMDHSCWLPYNRYGPSNSLESRGRLVHDGGLV